MSQIVPTSSHAQNLTGQTVNYFGPVLKGAELPTHFLGSEVVATRYTPQAKAFYPLSSRARAGVRAVSERCAGPITPGGPSP